MYTPRGYFSTGYYPVGYFSAGGVTPSTGGIYFPTGYFSSGYYAKGYFPDVAGSNTVTLLTSTSGAVFQKGGGDFSFTQSGGRF